MLSSGGHDSNEKWKKHQRRRPPVNSPPLIRRNMLLYRNNFMHIDVWMLLRFGYEFCHFGYFVVESLMASQRKMIFRWAFWRGIYPLDWWPLYWGFWTGRWLRLLENKWQSSGLVGFGRMWIHFKNLKWRKPKATIVQCWQPLRPWIGPGHIASAWWPWYHPQPLNGLAGQETLAPSSLGNDEVASLYGLRKFEWSMYCTLEQLHINLAWRK